MCINHKILWSALNCLIVNIKQLFFNFLKTCLCCSKKYWCTWINNHSPRTVVKLKISTSRCVNVFDKCTISFYNIFCYLFLCVIILWSIFPCKWHDHLLQKLCWCRNSQLCNCIFILKLLHKFKMTQKRMIVIVGNLSCQVCIIYHSCLTMKWQSCFCLGVTNSVELPKEI